MAPLPRCQFILPTSNFLCYLNSQQLIDTKYFINREKGKVIVINDFKIVALLRCQFLNNSEFVQWNNENSVIIKMNKHDTAIDEINIANNEFLHLTKLK